MQKTLKWKFLLILAFLAICVYLAVSPKEKGGKLLSRLNLGLDLKGGIHLVLQVVTDDATNQELNQDAQRVAEELKGKNIAFESSKKGNGQSIEVAGVDSAQVCKRDHQTNRPVAAHAKIAHVVEEDDTARAGFVFRLDEHCTDDDV